MIALLMGLSASAADATIPTQGLSISGADWITIIQTIGQIATALFSAWIGYKIVQMKNTVSTIEEKTAAVETKVEETKTTIIETKEEVQKTKAKVDEAKTEIKEAKVQLDGRLTQLVEKERKAAHAAGMAEMAAIKEEEARQLIERNVAAKEKVIIDKAEAEAKVLKVAQETAVQTEKDRTTE